MKICILQDRIPPEGNGGAEMVAWRSAQALHARGHDVSVITTTARPVADIEEAIVDGIKVFYMHSDYHERWRSWLSLYNPRVVSKVQKILEKVQPEIVHAHNVHYHLSYHSLRVAQRVGAKVFLTAHDVMLFHYGKLVEIVQPDLQAIPETWDYRVTAWQKIKRFHWRYNPFRDPVIRRYVNRLDGFFAVSKALRDALRQNKLPLATVLYSGINVASWQSDETTIEGFKNKFELHNRKVILFGGRITARKGSAQLLAALQVVVRDVPNALLLIASKKDAYTEKLMATAKSMGIDDNVRCTGWLEGAELHAAYHAATLIAAPSICFDTFMLVVLEAMACKKPAIAACYGGARESIEDGTSGYIINPYDIETFAARITTLLQDDALAARFGEAGFTRVEELFTMDRHLDALEGAYSAVL